MKIILALAVLVALSVSACTKPTPDYAGCKAALRAAYASPASTGSKPPQCHDIDDTAISSMAEEIVAEDIERRMGDILTSPSP